MQELDESRISLPLVKCGKEVKQLKESFALQVVNVGES